MIVEMELDLIDLITLVPLHCIPSIFFHGNLLPLLYDQELVDHTVGAVCCAWNSRIVPRVLSTSLSE